MHAKRALVPAPRKGRAFCKSHGRFVRPIVQSRLSVCSVPHACRLAFLSLVCQSARGAATPLQRRTLPSAFTGARSLGLCHPSFVAREACFTCEPNSTHHLSLTCFLDERIVRALHPACWVHASSRETYSEGNPRGKKSVFSVAAALQRLVSQPHTDSDVLGNSGGFPFSALICATSIAATHSHTSFGTSSNPAFGAYR